ncbi:ABC transporter substrate-binding protein [Frigidibacter sp. MR17.24]|uniref:ABC transporter substrate-binding protein n=1 Tax=Frigidibacter sp. MR17.24 TaxID=3127345 RepID=UPI003012ABDE
MLNKALLAAGATVLIGAAAQAADLPAQITDRGHLNLTVNGTYAPMEYTDPATGKLTGLDIDLAKAIAAKLGLEIEFSDTAFAQLIPSLETGRTDFIISGLSDRASRRETMDFIDYLRTGAQFLVGDGSEITSVEQLCGKKVGTTRSTSFPEEIQKWSAANCEAKGAPAVVYVPAENSIDARTQLKQGRIDAAVQGSETIPYAMQNEPDTFRAVGEPFTLGYQGIAFRKADTELRAKIQETLQALLDDGTYLKILTSYGLQANAVEELKINAAPQ